MEKDAMMVFRLPSTTREALQRAADEERRSLSNMAVVILTEWLEAGGYLPGAGGVKRKRG